MHDIDKIKYQLIYDAANFEYDSDLEDVRTFRLAYKRCLQF